MTSLIEELVSTLSSEIEVYEEMVPISEKKTRIIVKNDLKELVSITEQEQLAVERLQVLEHKREEIVRNIAVVLSKDVKTLTLKNMIGLFHNQPEVQKELSRIHDTLSVLLKRIVENNERNRMLIEQSLEMIEFNRNVLQSTFMAPGGNNYTSRASQFDMPVWQTGTFDAKQ